MKKLYILIFLLIGLNVSARDYVIQKWAVLDMEFQSRSTSSAPFDVEFEAHLLHESGKTMTVPGFYNGDRSWIIRFAPSEEGVWSYRTSSDVRNLNNKQGKITVLPNQKIDRRGAIAIDPENKQRFVYQDGSPYFSLAFEIDWLFALDAQNPVDISKTRQIVRHMTENGFNKAIMNVYAWDAGWGQRDKVDPRFNFARPEIFPFGGTNQNPDHNTLNVEFFKRFDRVMFHLHEQEMVSHLMIYVWNKFVNWASPGSEQDNMYFDYVVKRYQAFPNLIWDVSKEALAYGMDDMDYITSRIERLRKLDAHNRLVTVHEYTYCQAFPDLVDFISIQEWRPNLYNEMREAALAHPDKPVFNVEHGGYEKTMHSIFNGAYTDPIVCLERNYLCVFAGTYSTYYWQNASWYELVYDPFSLAPEHQPNFHYYKIMAVFFSEYNFNLLKPAQYFYSPYCLTNHEDLFIYFIPAGMVALEGNAPEQARNKKVEVQWFNPLNGQYSQKYTRTLGEWTGFHKPAEITSSIALAIMKVVE